MVDPDEGVVRERLPVGSAGQAFMLYDLEGELFFGAAPELDRCFSGRSLCSRSRRRRSCAMSCCG
jgi:hypothetical protein